jgi:hypothetical protein
MQKHNAAVANASTGQAVAGETTNTIRGEVARKN